MEDLDQPAGETVGIVEDGGVAAGHPLDDTDTRSSASGRGGGNAAVRGIAGQRESAAPVGRPSSFVLERGGSTVRGLDQDRTQIGVVGVFHAACDRAAPLAD